MSLNSFFERDGYIVGITTNGEEFLFDKQFLSLISKCTWSIGNHGYIQGQLDGKMCLMHRVVTSCPSNLQVDHINHVKTDNRLCNLRIGTASHNQMNERLSKNNTSGFKGVSYDKRDNKWEAYININKRKIGLGTFDNITDAKRCRKEAEQKYFGEWSYENSQTTTKENVIN